MRTIVEYSTHKHALNAYPRRIVSPPFPSHCCSPLRTLVGKVQEERGWPFVYSRCAVCGFTVRRFASRAEVLEEIRRWRREANPLPEAGAP